MEQRRESTEPLRKMGSVSDCTLLELRRRRGVRKGQVGRESYSWTVAVLDALLQLTSWYTSDGV